MNDEQEMICAFRVLAQTRHLAVMYTKIGAEKDEREAATAAILMKAFELATQDLSVERRKKLLQGEWE